jgi:hypothetical protein
MSDKNKKREEKYFHYAIEHGKIQQHHHHHPIASYSHSHMCVILHSYCWWYSYCCAEINTSWGWVSVSVGGINNFFLLSLLLLLLLPQLAIVMNEWLSLSILCDAIITKRNIYFMGFITQPRTFDINFDLWLTILSFYFLITSFIVGDNNKEKFHFSSLFCDRR